MVAAFLLAGEVYGDALPRADRGGVGRVGADDTGGASREYRVSEFVGEARGTLHGGVGSGVAGTTVNATGVRVDSDISAGL